jgi:phytoene dehydrogenase-like protein
MGKYDTVVIGAGNGGLAAALALSRKGADVLLLERHNVPGGCATSFCRGRFEFEVALHQLSGMGTPEKPGPLRLLLGGLGVLDDLEFVEMDDLYSVVTPDGRHLTLKPDKEMVVEELARRFSKERRAIRDFMDLCYQFAQDMLSAFYFKDPDASREKYPTLYRYAYTPCLEVLDAYFKDPLLKAVLSVYWGYLGLPPSRLSFAYLAMLFFTYIEFKAFHVKGGSQALSNVLAEGIVRAGGTVRYHCGVRKIDVRDGRVVGVITENGEHIEAETVISNASQVTTYLQLVGSEHLPPNVSREMRGRSLSTSAFAMYIGFDCEPSELGIHGSTNFLMSGLDVDDALFDRMHCLDIRDELMVLSCYDVADPEFSPPGTCQVNVVTLKYGDPWLRVPVHHYYDRKYKSARAMLDRIARVFPGVRDHIEELEVATPLTHMRYLKTPAGAIYGYEHQTKDALFLQPSRRSPISGLYFAGGWVGDAGFQTTLESGKSAARTALSDLARKGVNR